VGGGGGASFKCESDQGLSPCACLLVCSYINQNISTVSDNVNAYNYVYAFIYCVNRTYAYFDRRQRHNNGTAGGERW